MVCGVTEHWAKAANLYAGHARTTQHARTQAGLGGSRHGRDGEKCGSCGGRGSRRPWLTRRSSAGVGSSLCGM
eukprot:scaffold11434_cov127-Isochrysis_galbana.AAC.16